MKLKDITKYEEYGLKKEKVDVSIWCITYNHRNYIRKTFEGFLNQKTNFCIEVFVYDDASTDGTSDIVREYANKFPEIFHVYISKTNIYRHPDFMRIIYNLTEENLTGRYIAYCEGDDYWIYDYKLQKQYDWLETHPDTQMCIHNAIRFNEETKEVIPQVMDMDSGNVNDTELILCNHGRIPTSSFFVRGDILKNKPHFFEICPVGDEPLRWWAGYLGDVYYLDKVWAVRNYMHEGSYNEKMITNVEYQHYVNYHFLKFLVEFNKATAKRFENLLDTFFMIYCRNETDLLKAKDSWTCDTLFDAVEEAKQENDNEFDYYFNFIRTEWLWQCSDLKEWVQKRLEVDKWPLYIYGAGEEAKKLANRLIENEIEWSAFIVTNLKDEKELLKHRIISINMLHERNVIICLGLNNRNRQEVIPVLAQKDARSVILSEMFMEIMLEE